MTNFSYLEIWKLLRFTGFNKHYAEYLQSYLIWKCAYFRVFQVLQEPLNSPFPMELWKQLPNWVYADKIYFFFLVHANHVFWFVQSRSFFSNTPWRFCFLLFLMLPTYCKAKKRYTLKQYSLATIGCFMFFVLFFHESLHKKSHF